MVFRALILSFTIFSLACAQQDGDNTIKTGRDPDGSKPQKPTNSVHRHVMLALAGWADLYSIIDLVASGDTRRGCMTKTDSKIIWNCPLSANTKAGRVGEALISRHSDGVITIETSRLGLYNQVPRGNHIARGIQDFELTLVPTTDGYRFRYISSLEVPIGASQKGVVHHFDWNLDGTVTPIGNEWSIAGANGVLSVLKFVSSDIAISEVQFKMEGAGTLSWQGCGTVGGKFSFSGDKQDLVSVVADHKKGVQNALGGKSHRWAECSANGSEIYGLVLTAPFWAQPTP